MAHKAYIPDSDCECYFQAVELLNEILDPLTQRIEYLENQFPQYSGMSTDTKPNDAEKNAIFFEVDTGKFYYFDGDAWNEISCGCGGSCEGGSFTVYYPDCSGNMQEDEYVEALAKVQNGENVYIFYRNMLYASTGNVSPVGEIEFTNGISLARWLVTSFGGDNPAPKMVIPVSVRTDTYSLHAPLEIPHDQTPSYMWDYIGRVEGFPHEIYPYSLKDYVTDFCALVLLSRISESTYNLLDSTNNPITVNVLNNIIYQYMYPSTKQVTAYRWDNDLNDFDRNNPITETVLYGGNFYIVFDYYGTYVYETVLV